MGYREATFEPRLSRVMRSARLGQYPDRKHAIALIRAGGHDEEIEGVSVRFTGSMLAAQFAYDRLRASSLNAVNVAAIRSELDQLWSVRHHFSLDTATGYTLGLAQADTGESPT